VQSIPDPNEQAGPLRVVGDCRTCGELVEYITEEGTGDQRRWVPDPYWRHVGPIPDPPHAAAPTNKRTER
jgi:hypothetical protein